MTTHGDRQLRSRLREPLDDILGTRGQLRILRALDHAGQPMSVRELARRAGIHLRGAQIAVDRLVGAGILERQGTGDRKLVGLRVEHPLVPALRGLFESERARFERLVDTLKDIAQTSAPTAQAVWIHEAGIDLSPSLQLGVLARSSDVDRLVDTLRESVGTLGRREDVPIEVRGWTRPDVDALRADQTPWSEGAVPLWGVLPHPDQQQRPTKGHSRRAHHAADAALRDRAQLIAKAVARRPELVALAAREIAKRLKSADPRAARTLREWQQVLESMTVDRLCRWLADGGEQATRLRQSMPVTFLRAARELQPPARRRPPGGSSRDRRKP